MARPDTYKKATCRGAITIDNEEEIFIDKPLSEKGAERELVKRLEESKNLREKVDEVEKELEKQKGKNRKLIRNYDYYLNKP